MNREELRERLLAMDVVPECFELEGSPADDAYVLERKGSGWLVYYAERGQRFDEHDFKTEEEACQYIFDRLVETDSTRRSALENHRPPEYGDPH